MVAGVVGVGTLTVVDGADNLAAYTPVFATADAGRIAVTLVVFAVGVAVWCAAGALLTRHHRITDDPGALRPLDPPGRLHPHSPLHPPRHQRPHPPLGELVAAGLVERGADLGVGQRGGSCDRHQ